MLRIKAATWRVVCNKTLTISCQTVGKNLQAIMKITFHSLFIPLVTLTLYSALALQSCSGTERTEAVTADITAAQMQGRNSARDIINRHWSDTTELMKAMRSARAAKCRFDSTGHPECAAAFDSAFIGTIRAVRPGLERLAQD